MAFDFVSEVDKKFFSDNLLLNEDWDNLQVDPIEDVHDFVSLLDADPSISADEFMKSLPDELELPVLDNGNILMPDDVNQAIDFHLDPVMDLSDSSDSGLDCGSSSSTVLVKDEPLSPASSHGSDTAMDAIHNTQILMDTSVPLPTSFNGLPADIKLESPPLTPERDAHTDITCISLPSPTPTNGVKIDFTNAQVLTLGSNIISGTGETQVIQAQPSVMSSNVVQFMNKKIKIQPKPPTTVQTIQTQLTAPGPGKPLVLTPEQFAKLTSQGVLKFHNPLDQAQPAPSPPPQPKPQIISEISGTLNIPADLGNIGGSGNEKLAKRQQRMIKNRESACLSRKRKKEYVNTMEKQLKDSADENTRLREQNDRLKKCIQALQSENERLKTVFNMGGSAKKATCVMAILLLVSLNLGPLTNIFMGNKSRQDLISPVAENYVHHGRSLMSFNENSSEELPSVADSHSYLKHLPNLKNLNAALEGLKEKYASNAGPTSKELMVVKALKEINIPISMCPSYFNSSESQRLMKELTGWVLGHKASSHEKNEEQAPPHKTHPRAHPRKKYVAPRKLKAAMKALNNREQAGPSGAYEIQLFTGSDRRYEDFFQAVQIRNDTFYVVSFGRDHLLLPATAHNKTSRPKMSLLMPAQPHNAENDTAGASSGHIAIMQIDCEVTATKLLHVSKSTIPQNMGDLGKNNHTAPSSVERDRLRKKWQQQNQKWRRKP